MEISNLLAEKSQENRTLAFQATKRPSAELLSLWQETVWGTEKTLYTIPDEESFRHFVPQSFFGELRENGRLRGGLFSRQKMARIGQTPFKACYQGLLSIGPQSQGQGYGRKLMESANDSLSKESDPPSLLYVYIETDNKRSRSLFQSLHYQEIGNFFVGAFSRFRPKDSKRVSKLNSHQKADMIGRLEKLYENHGLADFDTSLQLDHYYVIRDGERIVAGLQVETQRWVIWSLEGIGGKIARKLLPHLPILRSLFNPNNFRFLKFSHIYLDPRQPEAIGKLMEAVLFRHQLKTALMFWDERSPVYKLFSKATMLGLLNPLIRTEAKIMALPLDDAPLVLDRLRQMPMVISPSDP